MNRYLILLVAAVLGAGAWPAAAQNRFVHDGPALRDRVGVVERAQRRDAREEQIERTTRTLKIGPTGEIALSNISGDISIVRGGGNEATVEIVKTARARTVDEARELLGLVQVEITERGSRAEVRTRYPSGDESRRNRRNINVSVAFTLTAPERTRVSATSISGDIAAKDIKGDVALETVSGSVRISNAGRVAAAKSISGAVEVIDTHIEGQLEVSSVSGTVLLRKVKARTLDAASVSGNVVIQEVACNRAEAQSVSGNVEFGGTLANGGRYELSSHSGNVDVSIEGNTGFELEATSFSGSVRSDVNLESRAADTRGPMRRSLRGTYGDGSAILELTTFSGSIVVRRR